MLIKKIFTFKSKKIEETNDKFKNEMARSSEVLNEIRYEKENILNKEWYIL